MNKKELERKISELKKVARLTYPSNYIHEGILDLLSEIIKEIKYNPSRRSE